MFNFYDHRAADVVISATALLRQGQSEELTDAEHLDPWRFARPRYWISREEIERRIEGEWDRQWIPGWKEITSPTNARTMIPAVLPLSGIGHKIPIFLPRADARPDAFALVANLSSLICDYVCRNKLNGTSLTPFTAKQLPVVPRVRYATRAQWDTNQEVRDWLRPRVLELTFTAWDLEGFAKDLGYSGPPFRWQAERRFLLRAEIESAFLHLYGVSRKDAEYILDTFPIVRKNDEKAHGEYRTKRVILEIYDEVAEAIRTGRPYRTRLDPPPADPRVAHPPRSKPGKKVGRA
jgi:hypothetical protein